MTSVTYADGTTKQYHYEDARIPWLLTGITDETGQRFATYRYDEYGRLSREEHAGGVNSYDISYGESFGDLMSLVTEPLGRQVAFYSAITRGVFRRRTGAFTTYGPRLSASVRRSASGLSLRTSAPCRWGAACALLISRSS